MNDMSSLAQSDGHADTEPIDNMALMSEMLRAQALSLDAMFGELAGHATKNVDWPAAANIYARLAFRAQSNCRASLQAMAKADRSGSVEEEK